MRLRDILYLRPNLTMLRVPPSEKLNINDVRK
jgi:hypothetical protein